MAKGKGGFIGQDGLNAPDPVTGVSASGGDTQATVSFTAPSDVGGADVTEYRVTDSTGAFGASGSASPITVTGLTNGTNYTFNVWAINAFGYSSPSDASGSVSPAVGKAFVARESPSFGTDTIKTFNMTTTGNDRTDYGDLNVATRNGSSGQCSSTTRGIIQGGRDAGGSIINNIQYFDMTTAGDASDFGDLTIVRSDNGSLSNSTRGLCAGNTSAVNSIDYITIASTGNATDFGDMFTAVSNFSGCASPTRGIFAGGYTGSTRTNVIQYVTIASTGNAADFGNLLNAVMGTAAVSSSTRAVIHEANNNGTIQNVLSYITISSTGNATNFGDLTETKQSCTPVGSETLGFFCASTNATSGDNSRIDQITIASTGNATDFGDIGVQYGSAGGCSSGHGGLS
jgi:hypothetical protein